MAWLNKKKQNEYWKKYFKLNRDKIRKRNREKFKEKYKTDELFREKYLLKSGKRRLKIRFEIFKRDKFTCQYCGRKAPNVILHIDHIQPKSKGGLNNKLNLITSCEECNLGKGNLII